MIFGNGWRPADTGQWVIAPAAPGRLASPMKNFLSRTLLDWWRRPGAAERTPLPQLKDEDWALALHGLPFLGRLDADTSTRVRVLAAELLARKQFTGAGGLEVEPDMAVLIAVQAVLPVNRLGLRWYDDFSEIIVYPSEFIVDREVSNDLGLVSRQNEVLSGEAMHGGPVVLSWHDASNPGEGEHAYNVVIHEFAHKLDLADGEADGCPPLGAAERARWLDLLHTALDDFCDRVDAVEASIPADVDPESEAADRYWARLPLDAYAATDPAEFFAVASEAWFVGRERFEAAYPALAEGFRRLYG